MSPVFFIDEILARIFTKLDNSSKAICARVCRSWSTPALALLWIEADFQHLIRILGKPAVFFHLRRLRHKINKL
jgi:hypothetical protein